MKKLNFLLLSALVFALTFFSCNKHDDDKTEPEKTQVENNNSGNTEVTPEKVTVAFNISGGTGAVESQTVEKGTKITLPSGEGITKEGYKFLGWNLKENGEIISEYTVTEKEVTLFAVWVQTFTVEFDTDKGTGEFAAQTIEKGKTATEPETKPSKGGFKFLGWYDGDTEFDFSSPITTEITLKAKYEYAKFSVAEGKQVAFSGGNLQYHCKNGTWRFAPNQYDLIGDANQNISADYDGYIDLFGWGTWLDGGNPINNSEINSDYTWNNTKKSAIDKEGEEWVTLTKDEWVYLEDHSVIDVAAVDGKQGLVILPDDWTLPNGVTFNSGFADNYGADYYQEKNNYTTNQWESMEANGAVFLPAAGRRYGSDVVGVGGCGRYWSATAGGSENACYLYFSSDIADWGNDNRYFGNSVRLVRVLQ